MTPRQSRHRITSVGVVVLSSVLALAACSSKSSPTSGGSSSSPASSGSSAPAASSSAPAASASASSLAAMVPAAISSAGTIKIATDASYAPIEFFDTDGKTIIGVDVDLGNAIAQKLGLKADFQNVTFDAIIPALAGGKYDLGMSAFTDTQKREQTVDFVTYFSAGESLFVAQGNPKGVTGPDLSLCGLTVAVEKGTTEEAEIPTLSKKCTDAGKKAVTALSTDDQNGANLALQSGRAQVGSADSPVAEYAVKESNGAFELAGSSYETAPYGIAVPKNDGDFAKAIQGALQQLISDGTYKQILDKWGVGDGAIDSPQINGAIS